MDGLDVAATVIQFVEFTSGLITKGIAIHSSVAGRTIDHDELETITKSLSQSSDEIHQSLINQSGRRRLTKNEKDLEKIAADCQGVAKELLEVLANLASKGPRTTCRSFRQALRATWSEGKVRSLEDRLDRFRQQMMANVLNSLRQEADRSIREQSLMRESVERIEQLQRNSMPVGDRFIGQIMDGEQWRQDLIQMIHEQGQGKLQKLANLTQMKDKNGWTPDAVVVQEKRIRARILHKLAFRNMVDRERRISKAHQRTFEWIFCDPKSDSTDRPWSSFKEFLERPSKKIYWIAGKPGSGKSTLTKYIRHHPQTTKLLQTWSGNDEVTQAVFYFWNSGSRMQMSVDGLLQTVLHDCLRQLPWVVQEVLPERWEAATLFDVDDFSWSWEELTQALRRLITEVCPERKFFVMIDGLDECCGDQAQLVELISEFAEGMENLKLCVASRPWSNFEDAFKGRPSLMLQDLSATDIEWYIKSKFTANAGFAEFQVRDPLRAKGLLNSISKKAEGVFLWVHLVVQSLLEGLTNGDGLRDLHSRLEELPPNLEDLYTKILKNLDDKYLDHASRLFQVVRACDESPTLLRMALADLEDGELAMRAPVKPMSNREKSALCKNMKRKLLSRCRGLLEISSPFTNRVGDNQLNDYYPKDPHAPEGVANGDLDCSKANEAEDEVCGASMADLEVQYLHRSVRDYIKSSEIWSWLVSANEEPVDPHLCLLKSHLLQLKSLNSASLSAKEMGFHIWMVIKHAKRSLNINAKEKEDQAKEVSLLLDEIDKACQLLTSSPVGLKSTFIDRNGTLGRDHWSSFFILRVSNPSFLHIMTVSGVHQHLEMRLPSSDLNKEEEDDYDGEARGGDKMPLMIAALEGVPSVPEMQGYEDLFGPHLKVLMALLRKGEDCHKLYHGHSAWDLARNAGYTEILKLFEEYRSKPPPVPSLNGNRRESRNGKDSSKSPTMQGSYRNANESDNESNSRQRLLQPGQVLYTSAGQLNQVCHRQEGKILQETLQRNAKVVAWTESLLPAESLPYTNFRLPPLQPPRVPRSLSVRNQYLPSQPFYDTRQPYIEDGDEGDHDQYRFFNPGDVTHYQPPRRPISYSRGNQPGTPMSTMPPRSSYRSMDDPRPKY